MEKKETSSSLSKALQLALVRTLMAIGFPIASISTDLYRPLVSLWNELNLKIQSETFWLFRKASGQNKEERDEEGNKHIIIEEPKNHN